MKLPEPVRDWCRHAGYGEITRLAPVGGGCINQGSRLHTQSGRTLFLKVNPSAPADMFPAEAHGLRALAVPDGPRVPSPYLEGPDFILLEDLQPAPRAADYWEEFGRRLAALHAHVGQAFGFERDNYIGSTAQPNPQTDSGHEFFREHRLLFQARLARRKGLLSANDLTRVEALAQNLEQLIPDQPPSLIHGDLWSGNAITDRQGSPAMIDPAAHYGWAEAELGMTALFGGFPASFYSSYEAARPLEPGWRQRLPIYNLYHLLNHVNLFGGGYMAQVREVLDQWTVNSDQALVTCN